MASCSRRSKHFFFFFGLFCASWLTTIDYSFRSLAFKGFPDGYSISGVRFRLRPEGPNLRGGFGK